MPSKRKFPLFLNRFRSGRIGRVKSLYRIRFNRSGFSLLKSSARTLSSTAKKPVVLASNRGHYSSKNLKLVEWCAIQGSNLRKTGDSLGNSDSPSQLASQKIGEALLGLDYVVATWPSLSQPLKAAILAIVNSSDMARPATGLEASASKAALKHNFPVAPPSATGNSQQSADTTER